MFKTESTDRARTEHRPDANRARLAALLRQHAANSRDPGDCLHAQFHRQALQAPHAIALSCDGRHLSYHELDVLSSHLAHRLRTEGVRPESRVGLYAERSVEMVVGLLAILKAGGGYVPLDPVHPPGRLEFQLHDSRAEIVLAQATLIDRLEGYRGRRLLLECPGNNGGIPAEDEATDQNVTANNLAYIIYTSGSTGAPKGVPVSHANVSRLFSATAPWFRFTSADVWTLFHSIAFDFSVWELWGALLHGGRLVMVPYWVGRSPEAFRELLGSERVTVLNQTPSAFRQLARVDEASDPAALSLRWVIFGGEALELQSLRPWLERHGDSSPRLVNMYGITETTVHVTYRPIVRTDLDASTGASPIGRPIPDLRLYALDANLGPVPPGAVGEAYVGGEGLARGYLGRPALTAERFLPDPFSDRPGSRMYRSGDLIRVRKSGEFDYVGRSDRQVKIRGFRIELGEIEAALARQPELCEVAVVPQPDHRGSLHLVAYLVTRSTPPPTGEELRRRLKQSLPDYMVPAAYVVLDAFPLTSNGKLDVAALPVYDLDHTAKASQYVAPRTATEEAVARVWSEILEVASVGAHDDFFDRGGHSLLAAQVVSHLRRLLGFDIPLRLLFETPTVEGLARRIDEIRPDAPREQDSPIIQVSRQGEVPLSFSQRALWFLDRVAPGAPTFNVHAAVRITGTLDPLALERGFGEIVRRHEALRTTFPSVDGQPTQVISSKREIPLDRIDLGHLPGPTREPEARRLALLESRTPFDLATGPLVRAKLLRLDDREHAVLLTMHHIVTDGWSMGVAARELAALYEAFTNGHPSPLPELPVQYADYAAWQRRHLQGDVLDELVGFWKTNLEGLEPLRLPTDRPRPAVRSSRGDIHFFKLAPELSAAFRAFGREEGATLFMTLLAGFQGLLARYSGQFDIPVGVPVANRNRPEIESLIGYFVNMIVLRTNLADDPSFRSLVGRVRVGAIHAFEHQGMPFDKLVEILHPLRDPSRAPLFDVMFVLQNNRMPDATRQELTLGVLDQEQGTGTAKFDLTLAIVDDDETLAGSLEYNADLFDRQTIERLLDHFQILLRGVVAHPDQPLSNVSLVDESERSLVLARWNQTASELPVDAFVHRLFERQARRSPQAAAVVHAGQTLSYQDLNIRSNQVAHFLRSRGVGPEVRVGLQLDRSIAMAVGLLGILKAGGAYVPLDPAEPKPRRAVMLEQAGIRIVLTRKALSSELPSTLEVVCLDADWPAISRQPMHDLQPQGEPESAAYVLFTSGSTGAPRGVVVTHRSVVNHSLAAARLFALGAGDRVLQFSPLHFDIAVEEIFPTWIAGACLVLRDGDDLLDPLRFAVWIERQGITVLDLPTAFWHSCVNRWSHAGKAPGGPLRLMVVGGEQALPEAYGAWRKLTGERVRWINTYGPTEATVIVTAFEPPACEVGSEEADLPIGTPLPNCRVYVLDRWLRPVPIGLPGELFIGGMGVGRGYVNQPGATAERFVPDPFSGEPGARLFRTGDRVRWRHDGQLLFLGRIDSQAKIRGFRVEVGEVEAALREHPDVCSAAVIASAAGEDGGRLDAFLVARYPETIALDEIRSFLNRRLPGYMIPSSLAVLSSLPLTTSGKLDRRALCTMRQNSPPSERIEPPQDEVEARVAAIWEDLLDARPISTKHSFFDLGGHSLLAIRMLARIETEFGRAPSISSLLAGASISAIAAELRQGVPAVSRLPLVPLHTEGKRTPFFCVHPAGGIAYCFLDLARAIGASRPFYAFQAPGLVDGEEPIDSIAELARHYVAALRAVQEQGPYHLGGYSLGGSIALEMAQQLEAAGAKVSTLVIFDGSAPLAPRRPGKKLLELARQAATLPVFSEVIGAQTKNESAIEELALLLRSLNSSTLGLRRLLDKLAELSPENQIRYALELFELKEVYHREDDAARVRKLWKVLCANLRAAARYAPSPYDGRIVLFHTRWTRKQDQTMGWRTLAGSVTAHEIPGNHASILRPPAVNLLSALLEAELGERPVGHPAPDGPGSTRGREAAAS